MVIPLLAVALTPVVKDNLPPIPREFRAVWVATVDNIDWPSKRNLDARAQRQELTAIFDAAQRTGLNAIILQVRPAADALYDSRHEPWSEYLTGEQGRRPSPYYDPLAFAVEEAHRRGMELHCWFNPYRAKHPSAKAPLDASHIAVRHPSVVKRYGNLLWMDPGEPLVRARSLQVMLDVVKRYDVDGVHIDDYFYPYPVKGESFPDDASYGAYRGRGGSLARDDWRRQNVDDFVRDLYAGIKREKAWVKFGISPFGIYRPGQPAGIAAGIDQYAELYADARKWLVEGWCDYYTPQLYWPIRQEKQSYPKLLNWWTAQNPKARHLWPGNFTGRTNPAEGNWPAQEVLDQVTLTRRAIKEPGNVHFSMRALTRNYNGIADALRRAYARPAFVPASPWLDRQPPATPQLADGGLGRDGRTVSIEVRPDVDVRTYAVSLETAPGRWGEWVRVGGRRFQATNTQGRAVRRVAVVALDRAGNESRPMVLALD